MLVTSFPSLITVFNISGTGCSSNTPSSSPSTGKLTLMALHLAVVISALRLSLERYSWPESVESIWIMGAVPVTWTVKEGEDVMEIEATTDSTRTEVLTLLSIAAKEYVRC